MQPNDPTEKHSTEQAAALRRLRRARIAEATRIRRVVADNYLLTPAHLLSPCRVAVRAEARQVAMWLMWTRLTWPLPTRNREFPCEGSFPANGSAGCSATGTIRRSCTASSCSRRG